MEAESSSSISDNAKPEAEGDTHEQQHEQQHESDDLEKGPVQDEEVVIAETQSAKKRKRRRRKKKEKTEKESEDEELDKSLDDEEKQDIETPKETPPSAANKKDTIQEACDSVETPAQNEDNDGEDITTTDDKTPSSGKHRKRNRKKKNTVEDDIQGKEITPDSKPNEPNPTNSTPKGRDSTRRKHHYHTPSNNKKGYETYWSMEMVSEGLKRGELLQGSVRISKGNFELAWVTVPGMKRDVFLEGMVPRNRALEGDVVVLDLLPRDKWKVMKLELEEHQANSQVARTENEEKNEDVEVVAKKLADTHLTPNSKTSPQPSKHGIPNKPRNADVPDEFLQKTASVVYIIEKKHSRAAGGHLKPFNKKHQERADALFSPSDSRLPRLRIPHNRCPPGFFDRPQDFADTLFIARITDWPESSSFDNYFAIGTIDRSLGEAGEIMPETEAILHEYEINSEPFSDEVLACLPQDQPWVIPDEELTKRRDLRDECVFTIDPLTARDLDDALHCKVLPGGNIEIGVHIADVSYFVRQGTALDEVAQSRATTTYLVQMVVPMLPRRLCEELCSLNPNEDRLTVSVVWTMNEKGEILSDWKGRSVIKSRVKLAYEHAQEMIQNPSKKWDKGELPPISQGTDVEEIASKVRLLHKVAGHLRRNRIDNGALKLDQAKLQFDLDKKTGMPNGYHVYKQKDSNRLVEEFMLLANMAVAHHIYKAFPKIALLRRHPKPGQRQLDELVKLCKTHGIQFNAQSSKTIHQSLAKFPLGSAKREILVQYTMKPMKTAEYFSAGSVDEDHFYHFALSVPFYTHFTSPIRRYADVIVHRLLVASLGLDVQVDEQKANIDYIAKRCNDRKLAAKHAGELVNELFFGVFVRECGPLEDDGVVMALMDQSIDVFVPALGVTRRIYCKFIPNIKQFELVNKSEHQPKRMKIVWEASKKEGQDVQDIEKTLSVFSKVRVLLTTESLALEKGTEKSKHVKVFARIIPPSGVAEAQEKPNPSHLPALNYSGDNSSAQRKYEHPVVKKKLFTDEAQDSDSKRSGIETDGGVLSAEKEVQGKDKQGQENGSDSDDVIIEEEETLNKL